MSLAAANTVLQGMVMRGGFDAHLKDLKITRMGDGDGKIECSMVIQKQHTNSFGTLHGGLVCTLVDICGTIAIMSLRPTSPGVSIDLNTSFMSAGQNAVAGCADFFLTLCSYAVSGQIGEEVTILASVLKFGKSLSFSDVAIRRTSDNALLAVGRHTKSHK